MSRKHKKRNKPYTGEDAASTRPNIQRFQAVVRSPLGEWWHERKRTIKLIAMIGGGLVVFIYLMYELFNLVF